MDSTALDRNDVDEQTVGFTIRRQSHEALIHHLDGLLAVGESPMVPPVWEGLGGRQPSPQGFEAELAAPSPRGFAGGEERM